MLQSKALPLRPLVAYTFSQQRRHRSLDTGTACHLIRLSFSNILQHVFFIYSVLLPDEKELRWQKVQRYSILLSASKQFYSGNSLVSARWKTQSHM